jgi:hypothetical protein
MEYELHSLLEVVLYWKATGGKPQSALQPCGQLPRPAGLGKLLMYCLYWGNGIVTLFRMTLIQCLPFQRSMDCMIYIIDMYVHVDVH